MLDGLVALMAAVAGLAGFHLVFSHRLRAPAVAALGEGGFQVAYSVVSAGLLLLIVLAYHRAPHGPALWSADHLVLQVIFSVGGYFAATLFVASLVNNPGLIGANIVNLSTRMPTGVFRVTRHPMMFAIAIWSVVQILIDSSARNMIVFGGFTVLAVVGSRLQDTKKMALSGREWTTWVNRTPFWPNLRQIKRLGLAWPIAVMPWLLATAIEVHVGLVPIGLWYFFPDLPS